MKKMLPDGGVLKGAEMMLAELIHQVQVVSNVQNIRVLAILSQHFRYQFFVKMHSTNENYLKGYDMVISLSEDAINKQFKHLYHKEIPPQRMPIPEELTGYAPLPAAQHYINHNISIFPIIESEYDRLPERKRNGPRPADGIVRSRSKLGIEGEIDVPTVVFGGKKSDHKTVQVNLKFKKGTVTYVHEVYGKDVKTIDGWTLRWEADITAADIDDIQKDLVEASADTNKSVLLPDKAIEQFKQFKTVDSKSYLASSLFCLFESSRVLRDFALLDPTGKETTDGPYHSVATSIALYLQKLGSKSPGRPTPNNPFVLGYGISEKVEGMSREDQSKAMNTPYFIPRQFDLTVTKGDGKYAMGTLNYCILTNRPRGDELNTIEKSDLSAGVFAAGDTFFKRVRSSGMSDGADGIVAFSRALFRDYWLKDKILKEFTIKHDMLNAQTRLLGELLTSINSGSNNVRISTSSPRQLTLQQDCATDEWAYIDTENKLGLTFGTYGTEAATLTYTSDLQNSSADLRGTDLKRRIYLDCKIDCTVTVITKTAGSANIGRVLFEDGFSSLFGAVKSALGDEKDIKAKLGLQKAREAKIEITMKAGLDLGTSGASWYLSTDASRTTIPTPPAKFPIQRVNAETYTLKDNIMQVNKFSDERHLKKQDGVIIRILNHEKFGAINAGVGMESFVEGATMWASALEKDYTDTLGELASTLRSRLILPAGDVFEYKGLDVDDAGHAYALITYKTPMKSEVVSVADKTNMTFSDDDEDDE